MANRQIATGTDKASQAPFLLGCTLWYVIKQSLLVSAKPHLGSLLHAPFTLMTVAMGPKQPLACRSSLVHLCSMTNASNDVALLLC